MFALYTCGELKSSGRFILSWAMASVTPRAVESRKFN